MIAPFSAALPEPYVRAALPAIEQILRSGTLVLGEHTHAFEAAAAAMATTGHAVAVNSGTTALEIILRALDVRGRVVLVPTNTNYATAAAALSAGAQVQLYDSGLHPDLGDLVRRLDASVGAVVVVHIGGYLSPDLRRLAEICAQAGVPLIEDAAHAHGSRSSDVRAGSVGYAAAWSFFATKVISTGGEGGAITTDSPDLDSAARIARDQGKDRSGTHVMAGSSWRMTEIGAAIGLVQLGHADHDRLRRRAVIDLYASELGGDGLIFPELGADDEVSGHKCVAVLDEGLDRDRLRHLVRQQGVLLARGVYDRPLHRQPVFAGLNIGDHFRAADDFAARHICLPLWTAMDPATVDRVISAVSTSINNL